VACIHAAGFIAMILLGSFLHHGELAAILGRALEDRLAPGDAARLKLIVNLNSYLVRVYSTVFAERLFRHVVGEGVVGHTIRTKGELKDLIVSNPHFRNRRIDDLIARYRRFPEDYYRETPYEGRVFTVGDTPRYVGSRRVKRVRRIAEKCARRIIDYIIDQTRRRADELAAERARSRGIPKDQLITPREEMVAEFAHAERRILKSIRDGLFVAAMPQFYIDDVAGIRILTTPESTPKIDEYLASSTDITVVDEKRFSGDFNGRNMVVAWRLPTDELLAAPPTGSPCDVFIARNVAKDKEGIGRLYEEFLRTGGGHVRFEILCIDYEQLLESEIGRSMHEEHIREQREDEQYTGRLAQNVEALMVYLFAFAQSSCTGIDELPVKIRGTYLPDYLNELLRDLYAPHDSWSGLTF
jgi:hypothetical protein